MTLSILIAAVTSVLFGTLFLAAAVSAVPLGGGGGGSSKHVPHTAKHVPHTAKSSDEYLHNPNLALHYASKENLEKLDAKYSGLLMGAANKWDTPYFEVFPAGRNPDLEPMVLSHYNFTSQALLETGFQVENEVKIITHGFLSRAGSFHRMAKAYLNSMGPMKNVIVLDWSQLAGSYNYFSDAKHAVEVGDVMGELLGKVLIGQLKMAPSQIHAIGHSLGAHVVGHIGRAMEKAVGGTKGKIARVTGLDPAKPWFDMTDPENKIQKSDAALVDIIHTNSGNLLQGGLSFPENLGDVDFFPNGGEHQVGCDHNCNGVVECFFYDLSDMIHSCSHGRSHEYFTESIEAGSRIGSVNDNKAFKSYDCDGYENFEDNSLCSKSCHVPGHCAHMGELLDTAASNDLAEKPLRNDGYYLATNPSPPYSKS